MAGYVIWAKSPYYTDTTDGYAIGDGDPTEAVLPGALQPYPPPVAPPNDPPTQAPELPLAIAPVVLGMGMFALAFRVRRRRTNPG